MNRIALNMILGPKTAPLLDRCLSSFDYKQIFDEISLVVTAPDDAELIAAAKKYTGNITVMNFTSPEYPAGNFEAARNEAVKHSQSEYIMWLDTDDVIEESQFPALLEIKQAVNANDYDMYFIPYRLYGFNDKKFIQTNRERIIKRELCKWVNPVHEVVGDEFRQYKIANFNGFYVSHVPAKEKTDSVKRNIAILAHERSKGKNDFHTKYYWATDNFNLASESGDEKLVKECINIYHEILINKETNKKKLEEIAVRLAMYYAYHEEKSFIITRSHGESFRKAETYARLAQSLGGNYAEADVILGDIYYNKKKTDSAVKFYQMALKRVYGSSDCQLISFYHEIPARRLSEIQYQIGNFDTALYYSGIILNTAKDISIRNYRAKLIDAIIKKEPNLYKIKE